MTSEHLRYKASCQSLVALQRAQEDGRPFCRIQHPQRVQLKAQDMRHDAYRRFEAEPVMPTHWSAL